MLLEPLLCLALDRSGLIARQLTVQVLRPTFG